MEILNLAPGLIIYISIIVLLFLAAIVLMVREIVLKRMSNYGKLSFYILVVPIMLVMIPLIGKESPIDLWLFGASLGAFIGLTFFSTSFKKKMLIFILIYGVIGIVIALVCEYLL